MQTITVSRNDEIYEAFADVAQAADGTLVCTYRESMGHSSRPFSRVIVRRSFDRGLTWGPRQVVVERTEEETAQGLGRLNCSRIAACRDGTLLLVVDLLLKDTFAEYLDPGICMNLLLRSHDNGVTWEGPEETGMTEGIVPSIKELSNGDLIVGLTEQWPGQRGTEDFIEVQTCYLSTDQGRTWEGPFKVPNPEGSSCTGLPWRLNEGDFAEMDDGSLVLYMREDGEGLSGWKSFSSDGGRTWSTPVRTHMMRCLGRPSVGRLRSGEVAITYRVACGLVYFLGALRGDRGRGSARLTRPSGCFSRPGAISGRNRGPFRLSGQRPRPVGRQRLFGLGATTRRDALRGQLHHRRRTSCPHSRLCSGPRGLVSLSGGSDPLQYSLVEQSPLLRQGPANGS